MSPKSDALKPYSWQLVSFDNLVPDNSATRSPHTGNLQAKSFWCQQFLPIHDMINNPLFQPNFSDHDANVAEILEEYSGLSPEDIQACMGAMLQSWIGF
ncbi:MAG: hypothetical protein DSM106950_11315 [Stigonema ocellatum SAG 48.90 = DSM 106950]|nr:hypothetical protein [Stigonema ocellatum SAG 48.90 = DSM 106950]